MHHLEQYIHVICRALLLHSPPKQEKEDEEEENINGAACERLYHHLEKAQCFTYIHTYIHTYSTYIYIIHFKKKLDQ